jgi:nucleotide-binding universal stress UspA family protein
MATAFLPTLVPPETLAFRAPAAFRSPRAMIATDGSEASCEAARQAVQLLPAGTDFFLVTVIDQEEDPVSYAGGLEGPVLDDEEARARYRESVVDADGALARTARAFGPVPLRQRVVERTGDGIGAQICSLAEAEDVAAIVVGADGHRLLPDVLRGSVRKYLLHHSPCPVVVVRNDA